jgi:hypothetical protein
MKREPPVNYTGPQEQWKTNMRFPVTNSITAILVKPRKKLLWKAGF